MQRYATSREHFRSYPPQACPLHPQPSRECLPAGKAGCHFFPVTAQANASTWATAT